MHAIRRGPDRLPDCPDHLAWAYEVVNRQGAVIPLEFRLVGAARARASDSLPPRVRRAIERDGMPEVEAVLPWTQIPVCILATTTWLEVRHRNGHRSRVGRRDPRQRTPEERFLALTERNTVCVDHGRGIEDRFEYDRGLWKKRRFQGGRVKLGPEPLLLGDVLAEVRTEEQRQHALDIDPEGAANLSPIALSVAA